MPRHLPYSVYFFQKTIPAGHRYHRIFYLVVVGYLRWRPLLDRYPWRLIWNHPLVQVWFFQANRQRTVHGDHLPRLSAFLCLLRHLHVVNNVKKIFTMWYRPINSGNPICLYYIETCFYWFELHGCTKNNKNRKFSHSVANSSRMHCMHYCRLPWSCCHPPMYGPVLPPYSHFTCQGPLSAIIINERNCTKMLTILQLYYLCGCGCVCWGGGQGEGLNQIGYM